MSIRADIGGIDDSKACNIRYIERYNVRERKKKGKEGSKLPFMSGTTYNVRVNYNSEIKGNFVRLPPSIAETLWMSGSTIQSFKFRLGSDFYISWDGLESNAGGDDSIEINPLLAKALHLPLGQTIELNIEPLELDSDIFIREVHAKPLTSSDWEIAELNSEYLQNTILTQTKLVSRGGIITCSIGDIGCSFRIVDILPKHLKVGLLHEGSLVIIEPKERNRGIKDAQMGTPWKVLPPQTKRGLCWNYFDSAFSVDRETVIYLPDNEVEEGIGILSAILPNGLNLSRTRVNDKVKFADNKTIPVTRQIAVYVKGVSEHFPFSLPSGHILLTQYVWNLLGLQNVSFPNNGTLFQLSYVREAQFSDEEVYVKLYHTVSGPENDKDRCQLENELETSLRNESCLLTNHSLMDMGQDSIFFDISDSRGNTINHVPVDSPVSTVHNIQFLHFYNILYEGKSLESTHPLSKPDTNVQPEKRFIEYNDNLQRIIDELTFPTAYSPAIVIEGEYGMGKTTLVQKISSTLISKYRYHTVYIDCERISDPFNYEKVRDFIGLQVIDRAYWHRPSVIILDNADFIFGSLQGSENDGAGHNAEVSSDRDDDDGYSGRITRFFLEKLSLANHKEENPGIKVIFSCSKGRNLNRKFHESHLLGETWSLKPLDTKERSRFLEAVIESNKLVLDPTSLEVRDIALETEGYSPADLTNLIKTLVYSYGHMSPISFDDFQKAKESFTPIFLQKADLSNSENRALKQKYKWDQIGGLNDAKKLLLETLEWPVKYAAIFKHCPLRLRSGILIYGYPGCGKTLLANTVAAQCDLHFISVKGPEVLNKYIGASEENIRNLFERAQSVKPCVLFFDEFESIAARRGHDSTGVTDRVVNQLLTQMDGVEGLDGVFVMAATSRPDLLDPALLRPGRLDKSVFCDLPDETERLDILYKNWSSSMGDAKFEANEVTQKDLILREVARLTAGFSGADLQRVCYNSYLRGVHRKLDELKCDATKSPGVTAADDVTDLEFSTINVSRDDVKEAESLGRRIKRALGDDDMVDGNRAPGESEEGGSRASENSTTRVITIRPDDILESCKETNPSISAKERARLSMIYEKFSGGGTGNNTTDETPTEDYKDLPVGVRLSLK